jgi:hypothetical protein
MQNAPPVVFPVGRCALGSMIMICLAALGGLSLGLWQWLAGLSWTFAGWAWGAWGVMVAVAYGWRSGQTLGEGCLFWSGEAWFWQGPLDNDPAVAQAGTTEPMPVFVAVLLDLGGVILLAVQPLSENGQRVGRLRHAWVQKVLMPSKWHGLRCAVYSRPKAMRDAAVSAVVRY